MHSAPTRSLQVFAPAKINLFLHVTGKRDDGYHLLDSLVCFTDIGDTILIEEADRFSFHIDGPFSRSFTAQEKDASEASSNIVVQAVWKLSKVVGRTPDFRLTLKKQIPLGSGIGGGSSDAAAILWALSEWWGLPPYPAYLQALMLELGSDVPACYACKTTRMQGIGEHLQDCADIPELPVLLARPIQPCPTADIYKNFKGPFTPAATLPDSYKNVSDFIETLQSTSNDLTESALACVPDIAFVLDSLGAQKNVLLSRMSGSGSCCFALFPTEEDCAEAAEHIIRENPLWWVRTGTIGRPVRY